MDTSMDMILGIFFLTFSNVDILLAKQKFTWRSYRPAKALSTTKRVKFIDKKKFAKVILDENSKIFVMYIATLKAPPVSARITVYFSQIAQIIIENLIQAAALQ